ncbi:hypothetical protein CBL_00955 [Carabus blaptoides fortunei]
MQANSQRLYQKDPLEWPPAVRSIVPWILTVCCCKEIGHLEHAISGDVVTSSISLGCAFFIQFITLPLVLHAHGSMKMLNHVALMADERFILESVIRITTSAFDGLVPSFVPSISWAQAREQFQHVPIQFTNEYRN